MLTKWIFQPESPSCEVARAMSQEVLLDTALGSECLMMTSSASFLVIPSSSPSSSFSVSASKSSMLKVLGVEVELKWMAGGEASRD